VDLARAEENLKAFQKKNKALDLPEQARGTITGVAGLTAQLAMDEVNLAALQRNLTESSQEVKSLKAVIATLKGQIARFEGSQKGGSIPSIGSVPDLGQEYIRLMRDFKIQETLVELLTKQYELAALSEAKNIAGVQVIQTARIPDKKIKPKRAIVIIMSTFGSILLTIIYLFILEVIRRMPEDKLNYWRSLMFRQNII